MACEQTVQEEDERRFLRSMNLTLKWVNTSMVTAQSLLFKEEPEHWRTARPLIRQSDAFPAGTSTIEDDADDPDVNLEDEADSASVRHDESDISETCSQFGETDRERWKEDWRLIQVIEVRQVSAMSGIPVSTPGI
jgi:hypothetical protein